MPAGSNGSIMRDSTMPPSPPYLLHSPDDLGNAKELALLRGRRRLKPPAQVRQVAVNEPVPLHPAAGDVGGCRELDAGLDLGRPAMGVPLHLVDTEPPAQAWDVPILEFLIDRGEVVDPFLGHRPEPVEDYSDLAGARRIGEVAVVPGGRLDDVVGVAPADFFGVGRLGRRILRELDQVSPDFDQVGSDPLDRLRREGVLGGGNQVGFGAGGFGGTLAAASR